jgi:NADH dehydrogenase (ubiquinone) Fe-S protein 3
MGGTYRSYDPFSKNTDNIQQVGPGVDKTPESFKLPTPKPEEKKEEAKK